MDNIKNMNTINLNDTVVKLEDVTRTYKIGENEVHALRGVSFEIKQGEFLAIMGPSGSGKSTCMNMIGCLDRPTSGKIQINGKFTSQMTEKELAILRNKTIGFVFQQYHLIPGMSVLENVMLPLKYQKVEKSERKKRAERALESVGLEQRMNHRPHELSGGQKQRVAIASALLSGKKLLIFDEPTIGLHPLDVQTLLNVFSTLLQNEATVIVIEHDLDVIRNADYIIDMGPEGGKDGGEIIFTGLPKDIKSCKTSKTAQFI